MENGKDTVGLTGDQTAAAAKSAAATRTTTSKKGTVVRDPNLVACQRISSILNGLPTAAGRDFVLKYINEQFPS